MLVENVFHFSKFSGHSESTLGTKLRRRNVTRISQSPHVGLDPIPSYWHPSSIARSAGWSVGITASRYGGHRKYERGKRELGRENGQRDGRQTEGASLLRDPQDFISFSLCLRGWLPALFRHAVKSIGYENSSRCKPFASASTFPRRLFSASRRAQYSYKHGKVKARRAGLREVADLNISE